MIFDTNYTRKWVTGTNASRELKHTIPRIIFGRRCGKRTITSTTKERFFDTRNGDTLPKRHLKDLTVCYAGTFLLTRAYIYPGEDVEIPGFDHAIGRRQLRSTQTLMATIVPADVYAVSLPMTRVAINFDKGINEPYVEISYIIRRGFMVYDGPQNFDVTLHFRDEAQQRAYCFEFAPPAGEQEETAA